MHILLVVVVIFHKYQLYKGGWSYCSALTFCLVLSIAKRSMLEPPTVIMELSVSSSNIHHVHFRYFGGMLLRTCSFVLATSSSWKGFHYETLRNISLCLYTLYLILNSCARLHIPALCMWWHVSSIYFLAIYILIFKVCLL